MSEDVDQISRSALMDDASEFAGHIGVMASDERKRVLIGSADDEVGNIVGWLGSRFGCGAVVAKDFDALQAANSEHDPDLILLGLQIGDQNAIDILRYLARRRSRAHVVLLGNADVKVMEAAERVGRLQGLSMQSSVSTPVTAEALRSVLIAIPGVRPRVTTEELRAGLDEGQFFPVFQPVVDLIGEENALVRAEVLARWDHPFHGTLTAGEFVDEAEDAAVIAELTLSLLERALSLASLCHDAGLTLPLSVNVSATSLTDLSFPEAISEVVAENGYRNELLTIELTESSMSAERMEILDVLTRLRLMGFRLSMDDFGTGYSTLLELVRLPFAEIKIDKRFVDHLGSRRDCDIVIGSTISLAHGLGMQVCAEGVETPRTVELLRRAGCDTAQGRYFQEPVSGQDLVGILKEWGKRHRTQPSLRGLLSEQASHHLHRTGSDENDSALL